MRLLVAFVAISITLYIPTLIPTHGIALAALSPSWWPLLGLK